MLACPTSVPTNLSPLIDQLEAMARRLEDGGREAHRRGEKDSALLLLGEALELRGVMARWLGETPVLTGPNQRGNNRDMVTAERVRVSKGRKQRDALVVAANTHNYTLRSLAEKLSGEGYQVSHALLSQARPGKDGEAKRSISRELAERIEKLTGFRANQKNWPRIR